MKFFTFKTKKLPREAKDSLLPRSESIARGKERFLAAFDASEFARNGSVARSPHIATFFKVGIGVMAACIALGLSAYADTANVSATNPLYPLKRIGENVQLALTPASEKPQLQATFAVRRADEIVALQASSPSSTLIPQLTSQLDQDINASLSVLAGGEAGPATEATSSASSTAHAHFIKAEAVATSSLSVATSVAAGPMDVYCSAFNVSTSGVLIGHLEEDLARHPDGFTGFNARCSSVSSTQQVPAKEDRHDDHSTSGSATSSPTFGGDHGPASVYGGSAVDSAGTNIGVGTSAGDGTGGDASASASASSTISAHLQIPPIKL